MAQISFKVQKRDTEKFTAKAYRAQGFVPGIFYGHGFDNIPIITDPKSLRPVVYTKDTNVINLEIEGTGKIYDCVLKEVKFDPVSDKIIHFDLIGVTPDVEMIFDVPVSLSGQPVGVRDGGLLQHNIHRVKVKCLPRNLPSRIVLDVANLGVGQAIYIKDVKIENISIEMHEDSVVASVGHSRAAVAKTDTPATAAAAAPAK